MSTSFSKLARVSLSALPIFFSHLGAVSADIVVTVEAPDVQASNVTGVTTMDFNSVTPGNYTTLSSPIGTYSAPSPGLVVVTPDAYGGANQTDYMVVGKQSGQLQATVTLNSSASYFGFYWGAGDTANTVEFLNDNTVLGSFNVGSIIPQLEALQAPSGPFYFRNPNTGDDNGEPFAYVNFIGTNGVTFNKVEFINSSFGSGFETDNHSFRSAPVTTLPGTPVGSIPVAPAPEPSPFIIMLVGSALILLEYVRTYLRRNGLHTVKITRKPVYSCDQSDQSGNL